MIYTFKVILPDERQLHYMEDDQADIGASLRYELVRMETAKTIVTDGFELRMIEFRVDKKEVYREAQSMFESRKWEKGDEFKIWL